MKKYMLCFLIVLNISSSIFAEEWHVKKSEKNLVKFVSSTPVLDFEGTTSNIDGYIYWEGKNFSDKNNEVYFEVDLNSVKTGNGKRDRDMREDVLETDKWSTTSFKGKIIDFKNDDSDSSKYNVIVNGAMFIHGHKKNMKIKAIIETKNNVMTVSSNFSVFLKDYEIEAPSLLAFIKVAQEIKLYINFQLERFTEDDK